MADTGHDVGPLLAAAVAVMLATVAAAMCLLFLDLRNSAAVEHGEPPASFVVVWTPATYGPPG